MNNRKVMITMLVAIDKQRVIGRGNKLMWNCLYDTRFFKEATTNHVVVMGRKTLDSIGHALPNRTNIVVSSNPVSPHPDAIVAGDVTEALEKAVFIAREKGSYEVFVIGGGKIYEQCINLVDEILITKLPLYIYGDIFFPEIPDRYKLYCSHERMVNLTYNDACEKSPVIFERWSLASSKLFK